MDSGWVSGRVMELQAQTAAWARRAWEMPGEELIAWKDLREGKSVGELFLCVMHAQCEIASLGLARIDTEGARGFNRWNGMSRALLGIANAWGLELLIDRFGERALGPKPMGGAIGELNAWRQGAIHALASRAQMGPRSGSSGGARLILDAVPEEERQPVEQALRRDASEALAACAQAMQAILAGVCGRQTQQVRLALELAASPEARATQLGPAYGLLIQSFTPEAARDQARMREWDEALMTLRCMDPGARERWIQAEASALARELSQNQAQGAQAKRKGGKRELGADEFHSEELRALCWVLAPFPMLAAMEQGMGIGVSSPEADALGSGARAFHERVVMLVKGRAIDPENKGWEARALVELEAHELRLALRGVGSVGGEGAGAGGASARRL